MPKGLPTGILTGVRAYDTDNPLLPTLRPTVRC